MAEILDSFKTWFMDGGLRLLGGIALLIAGWFASKGVSRLIVAALRRAQPDDVTIGPVVGRMARVLTMVLVILLVLDNFGVETTSIIAMLGAAGLAIGLALQGTLSNVAAGVMLLILRPFRIKDTVEVSGVIGTVVDISLFMTDLKTPQGTLVHLPNAKVWGDKIHNFTVNGTRRIDLVVGVSYDDDLGHALDVLKGVLDSHEAILSEPAPTVAVGALGDSSVQLFARPWVKVADFGPTNLALPRMIKERFDAEGIRIPFPQHDIHVHTAEPVKLASNG